jgi:hypothetical protein
MSAPAAPGGNTQIGAIEVPIEPPPATMPGGDLPAYAPAAAPLPMMAAARPVAAQGPKSRAPILVGILAIAVAATGIGGFVVYRQNKVTDADATVDVPKKKKKKKPAAPTSEPTPAAPTPPPPEPTEEPVEEEPTAEPSSEPAPSATNTTPKPQPSSTAKPQPSSSSIPKPGPSSSSIPKPGPSSSTSTKPSLSPKTIGKLKPITAPGGGGLKLPKRPTN